MVGQADRACPAGSRRGRTWTGRRCWPKIPQYKVFVDMPKEVEFYPEPLLSCWNEIESRLADQLPGAYVDPALKEPGEARRSRPQMAAQTDQILKEADLYGSLTGWTPTAGALPAARPGGPAGGGCANRWRIPLFCYVALAPVLALFFYVRIVPIGFGFLLSFYSWNLISPRKPFVGWDNYTDAARRRQLPARTHATPRSIRSRPSAQHRHRAAAGRVPVAALAAVGVLPDRLLPAGDHAAGADVDRLEVDLRLQLRRTELRPVAGRAARGAVADRSRPSRCGRW